MFQKMLNLFNINAIAILAKTLILTSTLTFLMTNQVNATEQTQVKPSVQTIILLGPPGSGKGTQAARISESLKIPHISTGDLFRANVKAGTELGKKVKGYLDAGQLVPDELVLDMLFDRVGQDDAKQGYLLDGFPRTLNQARALDKRLGDATHLVVVAIDVPDEVVEKRITGRRTCSECGELYNVYFTPPSQEGSCDKCGGKLTQRSDDTVEVVRDRLKVYHEQTEPLISYYKEHGNLVIVDGTQDPAVVFSEIMKSFQD